MAVEVNIMPGEGIPELTRQLEMMKESARIARSYIRSVADQYGLDAGFHKKFNMQTMCLRAPYLRMARHGTTLATAMMSAYPISC